MLILRKPWDSQPADFADLRTDGTIPRPSILWTGGLPGIDRASNLAVVTGAAVTRIIGTQGTAVRTAASATGFVTLGAAADVSPTGAFTVACLFKQDASINLFGFSTRNAAASATHGFELLTGIGSVAGRLTARAGAGTLRTSADASGLNDGKYHIALLGRNADNTMWFWVDGVAIDGFSGTVVGTITSTQSLSLARRGTLYADNEFALTAYWGGVSFSVAQRKAFSDAPWDELFAPQVIPIPVSAGGGVTGTSATTNAADTSSASGTTTVTGTSGTTNAADTGSASGTTTVTGTSATTNAADISAASGSVGGPVSGTSATTNADDAGAANGTTTVTGSSATTNAPDTSAASGSAGAVTGTSETTNANDSAIASGTSGTQAEDTHDGYWSKQWEKLRQREKKKRVEEVQDEIQEIEEQIAEVRAVTPPKQKTVVSARDFYAEQSRIVQQLITERQRLIETEEEEFLLLM